MLFSLKQLVGRTACMLLGVHLLGGCATGTDPRDPLESMNRGIYQFNEQVDKVVFKPVAKVYRAVLPSFVRQSVSNAFANVGDLRTALNNALQGKFTTAYSDLGRVFINSTLGVLGLF